MDTATILQTASIVGRAHLARHEGGQDACSHTTGHGPEGRPFRIAAIADGCGSAVSSQVGAALLVAIAARESSALLRAGVSTAGLVEPVLAAARRMLLTVATAAGDDLRGFVETHLLATLIVLADDGVTTTVFGRGDGLFGFDDEIVEVDEGGAPRYLAYDLFETPPPPFVLTRERPQRAFVATDGLLPELAKGLFGHRGRGLQRWLNVSAERAPLADDATVAVLEREAAAS